MSDRILENDLQLPALYLINLNNGKITTSELSVMLRSILNPTDEDLKLNPSRDDDKFSQIVRNLTAKERPFVKNGFIDREEGRNKPLFITKKGKEYLFEKIDILNYLFSNDFGWSDLMASIDKINKADENRREIEIFDENIMIQEGFRKTVESKLYKRSSKLREIAIEHFKYNGDILCKACKFSFNKFYGEIGEGYIEIHHIKPVFKYENDELDKTIEAALSNVVPVCSNCHRMIHRDSRNPLKIDFLIDRIKSNGIFKR